MRSSFNLVSGFVFFCSCLTYLATCTQKETSIPKKILEETPFIPASFIPESEVHKRIPSEVYPYLSALLSTGNFQGAKDKKIAYKIYQQEQAKATLLVLHGWTESSHQFSEFIYYLLKEGYNVFTYDHRSHGNSERLGSHPDQAHIEDFDDYIQDLNIFIETVAKPNLKTDKFFLYAHSMGALVGARYMQTYNYPFEAAILSTPMTEMANGSYPAWFVESLIDMGVLLGKARDWCPGQGPFVYDYNPEWRSTSSLQRHLFNYEQKKKDQSLQSWGASYNWYYEGYRAARKVLEPEAIAKIKIPVLIFQSGGDNVLSYKSADRFASLLNHVEVIFVKNGRHLLYMETDSILKPYLQEVFAFYGRML